MTTSEWNASVIALQSAWVARAQAEYEAHMDAIHDEEIASFEPMFGDDEIHEPTRVTGLYDLQREYNEERYLDDRQRAGDMNKER